MLALKHTLPVRVSARNATSAVPRPVRPLVGRCQRLVVRAESTETTSYDAEKTLRDLQARWDAVENKGAVAAYAVGAVVALWVSSTVVNAIGSVPLLPKLMELIGLAYSAWFTYRYLLFKSSREELLSDISTLSKRISGSE